jgi:hypothetical protein
MIHTCTTSARSNSPLWYNAATKKSPTTTLATIVGATKNTMRARPDPTRARSTPSRSAPMLDSSGSSAAATAMPNRLTGSTYSICA